MIESGQPTGDGTKIRVLIVDDIPETRENLRKLLFFESDIEVVDAANSGEEGITMSGELKPDIVLMDINMPGIDGITASEAITQQVPFTQIIMMSVQGEADYLRRSMLAGAREFLIKPFSSDELITSIRRVYELGASRREAMPAAAPPSSTLEERPPEERRPNEPPDLRRLDPDRRVVPAPLNSPPPPPPRSQLNKATGIIRSHRKIELQSKSLPESTLGGTERVVG